MFWAHPKDGQKGMSYAGMNVVLFHAPITCFHFQNIANVTLI